MRGEEIIIPIPSIPQLSLMQISSEERESASCLAYRNVGSCSPPSRGSLFIFMFCLKDLELPIHWILFTATIEKKESWRSVAKGIEMLVLLTWRAEFPSSPGLSVISSQKKCDWSARPAGQSCCGRQ